MSASSHLTAINWRRCTRIPGTLDHVPSKAEARISEGRLLCAGGAASPASVTSGLIIAIVAESVHVRRRHTSSAWNQCDDVLTWQANCSFSVRFLVMLLVITTCLYCLPS